MSRVGAFGGLDPLDGNPFAALARPRRPATAALPAFTPEEQSSLIGDIMEGSLGGLAYVGKVFDKFGRAARGGLNMLAGGDTPASELASFLPFSDALGITEERNAVQGTDLNATLGLTTRGDDSLENLAAGFATELLTDPLNYVTLGAKTALGTAAKKAGTLPRALGDQVRGGQAGLVGLGVPFRQPAAVLGTGQTAAKVADRLDRLGGGIAALGPVRAVRAAIDPEVGGAWTREGQLLAQDVLRPTQRALEREAGYDYAGFLQRADSFAAKDPRATADATRLAAEGFLPEATARATAAFGPLGADLVKVGQDLGDRARAYLPAEQALGLNTRELADLADYLPRSKNPLPGAGGSVWERFRRAYQDFSTTHGSQFAREEAYRDIPGGTVRLNEYFKDPALRSMTDLQRKDFFRRELAATKPAPPPAGAAQDVVDAYREALGRWEGQVGELAGRVGSADPRYAAESLDFFRPDPFADLLVRGRRSAQARAGAETVFEGVGRHAKPTAALAAEGVESVPLTELMQRLALDRPGAGSGVEAAVRMATRMGVSPNDLKNYALPADIARDVVKLGQAWNTPRELGPVMSAWNYAQNLFKTWVTAPFPAFHARNLVSGLFNAWRDDALSPAALKEAFQVIRGGTLDAPIPGLGATAAESTQALIRNAIADRVAFARDAGRAADTLGTGPADLIARLPAPSATGNSALGDLGRWLVDLVPGGRVARTEGRLPTRAEVLGGLDPRNVEGVRDAYKTPNSLIAGARVAQGNIDDFVQLGHYIAKLRNGFDPATAGLAVKKYHNDYSALTSTERNVLKAVAPWYSFSRRSLPPLLEDLVTKPAKVGSALRLTSGVREPGQFVPGFIAEGASVPVPGAPEGQQRYISSFGLPIEDEAFKTLGSFASGDFSRGLQSLIGMANPLVKAPLELGFGTQLYSGRRLEDLRPLTATAGLLNEDSGRLVSQIVANSPASRFASTFDKLLDERKGTATALMNAMSGVRLQDVDPAEQRTQAAKRVLERELRGRPGVRVAESVYVPADRLPLLDPLELQLYGLYRATQRQAEMERAARQQRAAR
jgi:hypothetical protein